MAAALLLAACTQDELADSNGTSLPEGKYPLEIGGVSLVVPSKMMDSAAEVTVANALKTPKIVFTPKQKMRDAANKVELSIDRSKATPAGSNESAGSNDNRPEVEDESPNPLVEASDNQAAAPACGCPQ